jgi:succinoglycan biosynthesis protein ExoM
MLDRSTPPHEILVVDNDADRTGEPIVRQEARGLEVRYLSEPQRGLARARNRLVHEARGEFVAFVDDDEEVSPRWLAELCAETARHGADGGIGPVLPRFHASAPQWMVEGRFFDRERLPTGTVLHWKSTRTGNCLIRRAALTALAGPFDLRFDLTGGEDSQMFRRLIAGGARLIAIDSAIVYEHLPATRTTKRWLLRRWFRVAFCTARIDRVHSERRVPRWWAVWSLARATWYAVVGSAVFLLHRRRGMRLLKQAARSTGHLAEQLGLTYRPYGSEAWS